ncbi:hypothetical protein [Amycolatopsis dongchuanensis]|uniref:Uncharacterized protein n=1 Tax=Amycolatopsis dongchuanensis TaxID=1070866 RepID=A0ABP8VQ25_9PSEU
MARRGGGKGLFKKIAGWFREPKKPATAPPPVISAPRPQTPPGRTVETGPPPPRVDPNPPPRPRTGNRYGGKEKPMEDHYKYETRLNEPPFVGKQVTRLNDTKLEKRRVYIDKDGRMRYAKDGTLFDTSKATKVHKGDEGRAIFVMDRHGNVYASNYQAEGEFHHSTLTNGRPVAAAGELFVKDGRIIKITDNSGHYRPGTQQTVNMWEELKIHGLGDTPLHMQGAGGMKIPPKELAKLKNELEMTP